MPTLGCSSGSPAEAPGGEPSADAGPPVCGHACVYERRTNTVCNEGLGPQYDYGAWGAECVDLPCAQAPFDDHFTSNPYVPCTSSDEFRAKQDYVGSCRQFDGAQEAVDMDSASIQGKRPLKVGGATCDSDAECASHECMSLDGVVWLCASECSSASCQAGFVCNGGYCFPACLAP